MKEVLNLALVFQLFAFTVGQKFKPVIMNFTAVIEPSEMDAIASVSCEGPANTTWQAQRAVLETSLQLAANDNTTWALETAYNCATNTKILDTQRSQYLLTVRSAQNLLCDETTRSFFALRDGPLLKFARLVDEVVQRQEDVKATVLTILKTEKCSKLIAQKSESDGVKAFVSEIL